MNRANNKNYAQAAAAQQPNNKQASHTNNHHQNQHHHHQQVSQHNQSSGPTTSSNFSSSTNGKPVNNNSQTKPQAQHNSTMGNGNTGRSQSIKQKNPITLPTNGHPWENGSTNLIFGSVNSPNAQISSLPSNGQTLTSGGGIPSSLPTKGPTFGTLVNNNNNNSNNNNNNIATTTTTTTNTTTITTTQAAQTTQVTSPSLHLTSNNAQVNSGLGANNSNNINNINNINNNNNNSNNSNSNGTSNKSISARTNEPIPRTHSAPPLSQSSHTSNVAPARNNIHQQQQPAVVSHQQPVNNPPINNNRKDSVSSNVSSNDGQPQPFHPHHSTTHNPNHSHTTQHSHPHYNPHRNHNNHNHHSHHKPGNMGLAASQYNQRRDKNGPHLTAQPVQTQVPMAVQYAAYSRDFMNMNMQYYQGHYVTPMFHMPYVQQPRPPMPPQQPIAQVSPAVNFTKQQNNKRIEIIDPLKNAPIQFNNVQQQQPQQLSNKNSNHKRDEVPITVSSDKKLEESDKEKPSSDDKNVSRAVPIVNPEDKDKEERERKEQEEKERLEKEKAEQMRKEEEERLEKERIKREEKEKKERDEKERLERERKEQEERERKEREERERKEQEERERKEREERERLEKEKKEKEERERREREEREERERLEKERLEKEKKEKEEQERREQEERKRLEEERIEKERKEAEEKKRLEEERIEKERKEAEEKALKEKEEKEKAEKDERERIEKERIEKERIEKEKAEKEEKEKLEAKKKEEEEAKTKVLEEAEKNKDDDKKDSSKKEEKKPGKNRPHPGHLDLSRTTSPSTTIPSAPPSALNSARLIEDINSVTYPPNIRSPKPELNSNALPMKFKYDRDFLMQFMSLCVEKPDNLPALEAIDVNEAKDDKKNNRSRANANSKTPHRGSPGNQSQFTNMTEFKFPPKSGTTSEERFAASMRNGTTSSLFGRGIGRTASGSNLLPPPGSILSSPANPPSPRTSSGRRSDGSRRNGKGAHQIPNALQDHPIVPLERSENRWIPSSKVSDDNLHIETTRRKVKALLNKLTLEKFDSISDQIIDYANKSRDEKDGGTLKEVIRLIFEKSCDESNFCAMYAQLCRKMMERVDPEIVDENVKNTEGRFVQGGTLFRKYLLNRCQEEFEKGWKVNIPLPSNEKGEPDLMSDEYYAAAKAKRQGLGLIRFIGELFKLNMLTERIMHECIKKLLTFQGSPEEEEMESLCKLLNTVGEQLDHFVKTTQEHKINQLDDARAKQLMDSYFNRLEETSKLPNLSSRIKFMIMDVIDLRNNYWKPRRDINAPKTIAEIHEDAAKQKEEAEYLKRTSSSGGRNMPKYAEQMSRSGSGRRDNKGMQSSGSSGNDGWSTVGSAQRNKDKAGDLSKFGSVNRSKISGNVSLAPGGILGGLSGGAKGWNNKSNNEKEDPKAAGLIRTNSTSNTYSVLNISDNSSEVKKNSDSSISEAPKPMERKKIVLAPRTKAIATTTEEPKKSMSEEEATKKINSMVEEYFSVLDHREVILCIKDIPAEYHAKTIESFSNKVIEKKQKDVDNVMKLFKEVSSSGTCDTDTFKNGFKTTLEFLMDIGADAPLAYSYTGQLLFSAGLDFRDTVRLLKPLDDEYSSEKIFKGYASALKNDLDDDQKYAQKIKELDLKLLFQKKDEEIKEDLLRGSQKK